ncbi:MAG: DUF1343 domain-containing protein [Saprospiraceae bacterium]|nr:DUF1343 domain-containing protein [Saprospiraceae bacterium]
MIHSLQILLFLPSWFFMLICSACQTHVPPAAAPAPTVLAAMHPGAWQTDAYFPLLKDQSFGLVCNHTSTIGFTHLVDTLIRARLSPTRMFAPEHGFRGDLPDGQFFGNKQDAVTGLEVVSLHGKRKKPTAEDLEGLDLLVFDIQDVGVRCYTYLSTLHYIMEAAAEKGIPVLVLDRPNPNGHYIDGAVLDTSFQSFVGMHPVPLVYGMTIGEYARMINGEGWLANGAHCDLTVIPMTHYDRNRMQELPEHPSPNLPNLRSILLYPSLCFFEGTSFSIGRGTDDPFQLIGHPDCTSGDTYFMPVTMPESTYPPQLNRQCRGWDLTDLSVRSIFETKRIDLNYLLRAYAALPDPSEFFLPSRYIEKLSGGNTLQRQIEAGDDEDAIRATWQSGLTEFRRIREKYLIYPDLE